MYLLLCNVYYQKTNMLCYIILLLKKTKNLNNKLKTIDTNIILSCLGFPNNWYLTAKLPQPIG